jgi:hypothetical protein
VLTVVSMLLKKAAESGVIERMSCVILKRSRDFYGKVP